MRKAKRKNWIRLPIGSIVVVAAIAACSAQAPRSQDSNLSNAVAVNGDAPAADAEIAAPPPGTPGGLPDDRTPLSEPQGPIDPRSAEAAGQVVQHYGALIEQKKFKEAAALWEDPKDAMEFLEHLGAFSELHVEVGKPERPQGTAGSIYIGVPVKFYGKTSTAEPIACPMGAILRRVNDVPGSTPRQRQWHIYGFEC
jgi:hypothetical protein